VIYKIAIDTTQYKGISALRLVSKSIKHDVDQLIGVGFIVNSKKLVTLCIFTQFFFQD